MAIGALYLLPRKASLAAIKKLVFGYMLEDESRQSNTCLKTALKTLVTHNILKNSVKNNNHGKYTLATDFRKYLKIPVTLHDEVNLEKFKAKYAMDKLFPVENRTRYQPMKSSQKSSRKPQPRNGRPKSKTTTATTKANKEKAKSKGKKSSPVEDSVWDDPVVDDFSWSGTPAAEAAAAAAAERVDVDVKPPDVKQETVFKIENDFSV